MKNLLPLILLSLLSLPLAHAQKYNQSYVIVGGIFLNLFKLPEDLIAAVTSSSNREDYLEQLRTTKNHFKSKLKMSDLSCEEKCFDDFRILSDARNRMVPDSGKNLLSFLNEKKDFADHIQRTVGYCWGHTSVTRNFNYLAHFRPAAPKLASYKSVIQSIMQNKAAIIPGYANLREFSANPEIKKLLKDQVVWEWLEKSMRVSAIGTSTKGFKGLMEKEKLWSFLYEVREKLSVNHAPKIFFSNLKRPAFIHVVSVYKIIVGNKDVKLCILDNHQYEDQLKNCGVYVSVKLDGSENYYKGWDNPERQVEGYVGQFGFTPEDDIEIMRFQKENKKMCLNLCEKKK